MFTSLCRAGGQVCCLALDAAAARATLGEAVARAVTAEQSARCVAECARLELDAAKAARRERTAMGAVADSSPACHPG